MLPSRGVLRCLPRHPLASSSAQLKPAAGRRQFGTALRVGNVGLHGARTSLAIGSVGPRRTVGVGAAAAGLAIQGALRSPPQARSISLWPWSSGLSNGDKFPETTAPATTPVETPLPAAPPSTQPAAPVAEAAAVSPQAPDLSGAVSSTSVVQPDAIASSVDALDGAHYLNLASDHIGYFKELGFDFGWGPTSIAQWTIEHLHVWGGMPWWAAIVGYAVVTRIVLLKPSFDAWVNSTKMQRLRKAPQWKKAYETMMNSNKSGSTTEMMAARAELNRIQKTAGITMWKSFIPMIQLPLGFGVFRFLRSCGELPVPSFENGGVAWFADLTVPDPYYVLPIASAAMMYAVMQHTSKTLDSTQAPLMKMLQYVLAPLSLFISMKLNAGLQLYFIATSLLQVMQTWSFNLPAVRRAAGVDGSADVTSTGSASIKWEAPKATAAAPAAATVATTSSSSASASAAEFDVNTPNPLTNMKNAWSAARTKLSDYQEQGMAQKGTKDAQAYEKKREQEDAEQFYARRQEFLRRSKDRSRRGQ